MIKIDIDMRKIIFKSTARTEIKDALTMIWDGIRCLCNIIIKCYDASIHRYPYAHIFMITSTILIYSVSIVYKARAERDIAVKKSYQYKIRLDSIMNENEAREGKTYVYND